MQREKLARSNEEKPRKYDTDLVVAPSVKVAVWPQSCAVDLASLVGVILAHYELQGARIPHLHAAVTAHRVQEPLRHSKHCELT